MRIYQYCYFTLSSAVTSASEITAHLKMQPDRTLVQGSKRTGPPPLPRLHAWEIVHPPSGRVDDQLTCIVERLSPVQGRLTRLMRDFPVQATMQVVRHLNAELGEEDNAVSSSAGSLRRLGGQHQLLGWHLDQSIIKFLVSVNAELDLDEYDDGDTSPG